MVRIQLNLAGYRAGPRTDPDALTDCGADCADFEVARLRRWPGSSTPGGTR